jgi:hypothetical protein
MSMRSERNTARSMRVSVQALRVDVRRSPPGLSPADDCDYDGVPDDPAVSEGSLDGACDGFLRECDTRGIGAASHATSEVIARAVGFGERGGWPGRRAPRSSRSDRRTDARRSIGYAAKNELGQPRSQPRRFDERVAQAAQLVYTGEP